MGAPAFTFEEIKSRETLITFSTPAKHPLMVIPNDTVYLWRTFSELNHLHKMLTNMAEGRVAYFDGYVFNHQVPTVPAVRGGQYDVRTLMLPSPDMDWHVHLFHAPYQHPTYGSIAAWSTAVE